MRSPRGRWRAALIAGAVLATGVPYLVHTASAIAPHLQCGVTQTGRWERIPVAPFRFINGIAASSKDSVAAYAVDGRQPQNVSTTNGYRVQVSHSHGCDWSDAFALSSTPKAGQPFPGLTSVITQVAVTNGRFFAAVREGSGATSRPHVLVSATGSSWAASDNGLPAQGSPQLLRSAGDGRTAYLTVSPTATGGDGGGTTGVLPLPGTGLPGTTEPTGLLYRTVDGGASWTLQTNAADLPSGGTGFSQLAIDTGNTDRLYGIVGGQLLVSDDGGASFGQGPAGTFTAVTAMQPGAFAAFTNSGTGYVSTDGGRTYGSFRAPDGVTSAAFRSQGSEIMTETSGTLRTIIPGGATVAVPAAVPATKGSLLGDRGLQSSFHALAGHALLRYVDAAVAGNILPPPAVGDISVPPPVPGTVLPAVRNISLPVGSSEREDFTLNLPKNPTPLDLFFLVDVSTGMDKAIDDVKANLTRIVTSLTRQKVDVRVGVGTVGTGPAKGEDEYPPAYVYPGDGVRPSKKKYVKPTLYHRIRAVGATGPSLTAAINQVQLETAPTTTQGISTTATGNHEGQLLALQNVAEGLGNKTETEDRLNIPNKSEILPGQGAEFRSSPDVRRIVILATNEAFDAPYGTPQKPGSNPHAGDAKVDFTSTLQVLNKHRIQVIGLTAGGDIAADDLRALAVGTRSFAPAQGVACDGDQVLSPGEPLVCNNGSLFSEAIIRVLASLVDRQNVSIVPANRTPVLGALNGGDLRGLDVKRPNTADFSVQISCVNVKPGRYAQDVQAVLRSTVVGRARMNVTCVKAAAALPPKPLPPLGNPPPPPANPPPAVTPPVAPPAPAAQPQVQPQVNVQTQIQPMTSGAIQEQQELQLALALNGTLKDDDPVFNPGAQMAMVDRRKREEVQALGVLAFAMTACAGVGLARLRSRPDLTVRPARST